MGDEPPPAPRIARGRVLVPPSVWFSPVVSNTLPLPPYASLGRVAKPSQPRAPRAQRPKLGRKRPPHTLRPRQRNPDRQRLPDLRRPVLPASQSVLAPLLTSYTEVGNYSTGAAARWQTDAVRRVARERLQLAAAAAPRSPPLANHIEGPEEGEVQAEDAAETGCNSNITVLLQPTTRQRLALDAIFEGNRLVYNRTVALTRSACARRDPLRRIRALARPVSQKGTQGPFFTRRKARKLLTSLHCDVGESAYDDFIGGLRKARRQFYALRASGSTTTYPVMRFRQLMVRSNSVSVRTKSGFHVNQEEGNRFVSFHARYFGAEVLGKGIRVKGTLPPIEHSVRLIRRRGPTYYLAVPCTKSYPPTKSKEVAAYDPGVRNFGTIVDTAGRTLSITDPVGYLRRRFNSIDVAEQAISQLFTPAPATPHQPGTRPSKSPEHRKRGRLRRFVRFNHGKVTRAVDDMHHKLAKWMASEYEAVLLPSFRTSEMVRKYAEEMAQAGTPLPADREITDRRGRRRTIRASTVRAMQAQSHYRFSQVLAEKMRLAGGRLLMCEEEYTSKTCSQCGHVKHDLGGQSIYRCEDCHAVIDRDINGAKNIFIKNVELLFQ
jgi:transposase